MRKSGMTVREAAEEWVHEMNAFSYGMIEKLISADIDGWHEVTEPSEGDRVYVYESGRGTIDSKMVTEDGDVFVVEMDDGKTAFIECGIDDFEVEYDSMLPMWGTMWSFGDSADDYWLESLGGMKIMSDCGFRIFESEEFGYFFGIDGAGYDFYESHWVPLYKARGLQWHDPATESGSFVMTEWRKADLYEGLLDYLSESISSSEELVNVLKGIGFRDEEIAFEGLEVIGNDNADV